MAYFYVYRGSKNDPLREHDSCRGIMPTKDGSRLYAMTERVDLRPGIAIVWEGAYSPVGSCTAAYGALCDAARDLRARGEY